MTGRHYDVVVVGGGPAGGTAAYELARRGVRVLLLEKEQLPRYKPCAGGLTLKTVQVLDIDLSPAFEERITTGMCTFRGGSPVTMDFGETVGWTVMREKFDYLILQAASRVGAEIVDGLRVRVVDLLADRAVVRTTRQAYSSSIVIGADGAYGVVSRCAGLVKRRHLAVALEMELRASADALERRRGCAHVDFGATPSGYGWIFPKKEILSVGVGTFWGKARSLKASLLGFLRANGLAHDLHQLTMRGHIVPLGGRTHMLHRGRALLTGDAASLAEPMTGEGIYYAVKSAKIAAETVLQALGSAPADLSSYTARVNAEITHDLKYADRLARLFYGIPRLCFHFFVRSPFVQWRVADAIRGRSSFERLYYQLLRSSPRILLSGLRR